jgi:hypothetical protein
MAWEKGVPISDAWQRFAPSELVSEYEQTPGFLDGLSLNPKPESGLEILKSFSDGITRSQYRTKLEGAMKDHLLTDLFNGQLIATGYREFPTMSQSPVIIDPAKFENDDPDWQKQCLAVHGVRYGRIRITDPAFIENHANPEGPRGSKAAIENAVAQLAKSNSEFGGLPRKISCDLVRNHLGQEYNAGNGLSNENISKAIVRICGSRKIKPISY